MFASRLPRVQRENRTTLVTFSEDLSNAAWTKNNCTVTADAIAGPYPNTLSDKIVELTDVAQFHFAWRATSALVDSTVYTTSAHLKAAERGWAALSFLAKNGVLSGYYLDLSTGSLGASFGSPANALVVSLGSGWWRLSFSANSGAGATAPRIEIYTATASGTAQYNGVSGSGIYAFGAQVELGANVGPYIRSDAQITTRRLDHYATPGIRPPIGA